MADIHLKSFLFGQFKRSGIWSCTEIARHRLILLIHSIIPKSETQFNLIQKFLTVSFIKYIMRWKREHKENVDHPQKKIERIQRKEKEEEYEEESDYYFGYVSCLEWM